MDPIDFIITLQKQNKRSLTLLSPDFLRNFVNRHNLYLTVREARNRHVGYLLHSRIRPGMPILLHQICVAKHARGRGHGRRLIKLLIIRCRSYGTSEIITTCPTHLKAATFFPHLNFIQTLRRRDKKTLTRYNNHYSMPLDPNPTPQDAPKRAPSRWNGYPRNLSIDAYKRLYDPANSKKPKS